MSNTLRALIEQMRREVLSLRHRGAFAGGQDRSRILAAYPGPREVLAALSNEREEAYPEREALTRTLMTEHRGRNGSLWPSMLVVAYYPMLSRLRFRTLPGRLTPDDLDQLVLSAFLAALDEVPFERKPDRIALRLRQRTARNLFTAIRRDRGADLPWDDIEELEAEHAMDDEATSSVEERIELRCLVGQMFRAERAHLLPIAVDLVVATMLENEDLSTYIRRVSPGGGPEHLRDYQRLKRLRTRALQRLRGRFVEVQGAVELPFLEPSPMAATAAL